jgi:hypothetical protein
MYVLVEASIAGAPGQARQDGKTRWWWHKMERRVLVRRGGGDAGWWWDRVLVGRHGGETR